MTAQLTEDLTPFKTIILSLISYANHPKLDTLIEKLTPKLTSSKRFLIKMEIKRLAKPCVLVIDFRPYFDQCEPVTHENVCHYLDEISKTLFLDSIKNNNGLFSQHIYNELNAHAKKRHRELVSAQDDEKARSKIAVTEVKQVCLVNDSFFNEPQVKGKSKCRLFNYDPLGMSRKGKLEIGTSVTPLDLNHHSCVIKSPFQAVHNTNEPVYLWLYDHDSALDFDEDIVLEFTVEEHKQPKSGKQSHYLLKLSNASDNKMLTHFDELLSKQRQLTNQAHRKQIQPLMASINAKCHEQFLLSTTLDIPMLCAKYQTGWRPSICLKTPSNDRFWQYFNDNKNDDPLARLFGNAAIQEALNSEKEFDDYAYILKHPYQHKEQIKQQFIIIWQSKLEQDYSARKLLSEQILQGDYRYLRLRILPVNALQDAYVPSALPDYISPTMALLNRPHTKQTTNLLKASKQLAILTDVTELNDILGLSEVLAFDHKSTANGSKITCPNKFLLPKLSRKSTMEIVTINEDDIRTEDRFEYSLELTLTHWNKQKVSIKGHSKNISTKGMLVLLDKPIKLKPGADLRFTMEVPYRGKIITMPNQAYQLLSCHEDTELRLTINGPEAKHAACIALREFIYQYMDDLPHCGYEAKSLYGLQKAMRNIYANNHLSVPFFIHQDKRQWHINSIAMNHNTKVDSFASEDTDIKFLLLKMVEQEKFRDYCLSLLNKVDELNPVKIFYVLTIPRKSAHSDDISFWFSDINQLTQKGKLNDVLTKIRSIKQPSILRVQLSKPNKIIDKYFRDELHYLEQISSESAQELHDNLNLMMGIGEITDHTQQVLQLIDNYVAKEALAEVI